MPTSYTEAVWRSLYKQSMPDTAPGVASTPRTYGRDWLTAWAGQSTTRKDWLTGYGLDNNARVIVIGCGYGGLNEHLIDQGITDTWGVEGSPYIWANTGDFRADVLAQTVDATVGVDSLATIQGLFQAKGMSNPRRGDWIVDEDAVSSSLNDTEIAAFLTGCEELLQGNAKGRIVHVVTPGDPLNPGDSSIIWQPMSWWKAKAPDHTWVDARTGVVEP